MSPKRILIFALALIIALALAGCGGKSSSLEGKVVDGAGKPIAGLKIIAKQVTPIKGYEQFEAVSGPDGVFKFNSLFPSSQYVIEAWSRGWTSMERLQMVAAPDGETLAGQVLIIRYTVSPEGVITDTKTGLDWLVGPDRDITYREAETWVVGSNIAGGGWRIPTQEELKSLYTKGMGQRNMPPAFKTTGWNIWTGLRNPTTPLDFDFKKGTVYEYGNHIDSSRDYRTFAVRLTPK